jgi:hypothetical protein
MFRSKSSFYGMGAGEERGEDSISAARLGSYGTARGGRTENPSICWEWSPLDFNQQHPCVQHGYEIGKADCRDQPVQPSTGSNKKGYSSDQVRHE